MVMPLNRDLKPDLPDEKKRILKAGGRVEQVKDRGIGVGPFRVWLKKEDIPGLAMSRSIGDLLASSVGVTCEPEIIEFDMGKEPSFLVVCSDGVWEFLSNEEVMSMVMPYYQKNDPKGACDKLVKESTKMWEKVMI